MISSRIKSGAWVSTACNPAAPPSAVTTLYFCALRISTKSFTFCGVSSTTKMVGAESCCSFTSARCSVTHGAECSLVGASSFASTTGAVASEVTRPLATTSTSRCSATGFASNPSKPAFRILSWSDADTDAVSAMMGICRVDSPFLICSNASNPLMPGNWISIRIKSGPTSDANRTPSSPVTASTTR